MFTPQSKYATMARADAAGLPTQNAGQPTLRRGNANGLCGRLIALHALMQPVPWTRILALSLLLLASVSAFGVDSILTLAESPVPQEPNVAGLSVLLSAAPGQRVAALQFDVSFDPTALTMPPAGGVETGAPAKAAQKQTQYSPTGPGQIRVLVVGFNQESISNGEVARLSFAVQRDHMHAMETVHIRNVVMSDPNGARVSSGAFDGVIRPSSAPETAATPSEEQHVGPWMAMAIAVACGVALIAGWTLRRSHARENVHPVSKHGAATARKHVRSAR